MFTTRWVEGALQAANPGEIINEDRIRHPIRRGVVRPKSFAGRLAWTVEDVLALAQHLGVAPPRFDVGQPADVGAAAPVAKP